MRKRLRTIRQLLAVLAFAAAWSALGSDPAGAQTGHEGHDHGTGEKHAGPSMLEFRQLVQQANDPAHAAEALDALRMHLVGSDLNPQYRMFMRRLVVRALIVSEAPVDEIIKEAEALAPDVPQDAGARVYFYAELAQALVARDAAPEKAVEYARQALNEIPPDEAGSNVESIVRSVLGRAHLAEGNCEPAIENLSTAVVALPDSQPLLYELGSAHEMCGNEAAAIDYYVRSLGVFLGSGSGADEPLRALYEKTHGSLDGLEARIDEAREASVQKIVFDSRRYEADAPAWALENLDGITVDSKEFEGKIVVLNFWGSWCGPCRLELPHFQAMYEKYSDQDVVFFGVNWERADRSQRKAIARAYLTKNELDFPVVVDMNDKTPVDFQVASFPTVFLIDTSGKIRYRNEGYSDAIDEIFALQLESLIAERDGTKSAKN